MFLRVDGLVGKKKIKNVKNKEKRKLIAYVFSRNQISQVIQVAGLSAIGLNWEIFKSFFFYAPVCVCFCSFTFSEMGNINFFITFFFCGN